MNRKNILFKALTILMVTVFLITLLTEINSHTYTTGICNFNSYKPKGITDCFGIYNVNSLFNCGHTFHIN